MAGAISTFLLASTVAGTTIHPLIIWKRIKLAIKILKFFSEVPEWVNYNRNLEEHLQSLMRKMESLESVEADVATELENTEHSGKRRKREVDDWIRCVKSKALDIKKVDTDFNRVSYLPRFLFRVWIGSCIAQEIQQVNELIDQGSFSSGLLLDAPRDCRERFGTNVLKGVVEKLDELLGHVTDPLTVRIGVQGVEGVGKSAIVAKVYKSLRDLCPSYSVYYVSVPQELSVYSLQASIAEELEMKVPQGPQSRGREIMRAARISGALKKMENFVLILDGLSHYVCLRDVGIPMEGHSGTVIMTSRNSNVCNQMSCQQTVVLEPLSKEDSISLFEEKLAAEAPLSEEIRIVADKIIEKCKGIPSSIITMAVELRGVTDVCEWEYTLSVVNELLLKAMAYHQEVKLWHSN